MSTLSQRVISLCASKLTDAASGTVPVFESSVRGVKGHTLTFTHLPEVSERFAEFARQYRIQWKAQQTGQSGLRVQLVVPHDHSLGQSFWCRAFWLALLSVTAAVLICSDESLYVYVFSAWEEATQFVGKASRASSASN
jgi:hypothetical protein